MIARRMWLGACAVAGILSASAWAQDKPADKPAPKPAEKPAAKPADKPAAKPGEAPPAGAPDMQAMMAAMEKARAVTEQHKQLEILAGDWDCVTKLWMDPAAPPSETPGTCSTKPILEGRYYVSEFKGTMLEQPFAGVAVVGYDNLQSKYTGTWIDNFGTSIIAFDGKYDATAKTFTYHMTMPDCMGGPPVKAREVIRVIDANAHVMEWYETRDGKELKTMEITYKRKKA